MQAVCHSDPILLPIGLNAAILQWSARPAAMVWIKSLSSPGSGVHCKKPKTLEYSAVKLKDGLHIRQLSIVRVKRRREAVAAVVQVQQVL